jgi:small-conductance mechanosensitive channel
MEPVFYGETFLRWFDTASTWLLNEVFTAANVVYTAMQIPAIVGAGFAAWWVHDFVYPLLAGRVRRAAVSEHSKELLLTLVFLVFPVLWMLGLVMAGAVAAHFVWPHNLVRIAMNLTVAWAVIRLLSALVRDPIWSRTIMIVAFGIAVLNILQVLDPALALMDRLAFSVGDLRVSLLTVLKGMFLFGALMWAAMFLSAVMERRVRSVPSLTPSVQVLIGKLLKVTLVTLAVLVSLTSIGVDFTALAVFSGALGVGIGFGLQKIISNLLSGIILLMDRSIKPGDIIQIGGTYGWVASLGARYVAVETRDGTEYLIPNEEVITQQVINWSHRNDLARIKVPLRISYSSDVRHALKLMVEAAGRPARVLRSPAPRALMVGFGDSSMDLELRFWIRDVENGIRNISSDVMLEIWELFREHDIKIPVPRREIHLHNPPIHGSESSETAVAPHPSR